MSLSVSAIAQWRITSSSHVILWMILCLPLLAGCTPSNTSARDSDDIDAIEAAKTITRNEDKATALVQEVVDTVDLENEESLRKGLESYKEAVALLDESVRLARSSTGPRLQRFSLRKRIANGYTVLYAMADEKCTPLEEEGLRPSEELLRNRAESKLEAEKWLKLARRDMETHLANTSIQFQSPEHYWELHKIYVQLADFRSARETLIRMKDNFGNRIGNNDRREIDSRIRYFAQKILDEGD